MAVVSELNRTSRSWPALPLQPNRVVNNVPSSLIVQNLHDLSSEYSKRRVVITSGTFSGSSLLTIQSPRQRDINDFLIGFESLEFQHPAVARAWKFRTFCNGSNVVPASLGSGNRRHTARRGDRLICDTWHCSCFMSDQSGDGSNIEAAGRLPRDSFRRGSPKKRSRRIIEPNPSNSGANQTSQSVVIQRCK